MCAFWNKEGHTPHTQPKAGKEDTADGVGAVEVDGRVGAVAEGA